MWWAGDAGRGVGARIAVPRCGAGIVLVTLEPPYVSPSRVVTLVEVLEQGLQCPDVGQGFNARDPGPPFVFPCRVLTLAEVLEPGLQCPSVGQGFSARDLGTAVRVSVSGGDGGGVGAKVAVPRCGAGI